MEGIVEGPQEITEIRIEAEGGFWTSGWLPLRDGHFETSVQLREGKTTWFRLSARDKNGTIRDVEPAQFHIRHGLVTSDPPLPHSIGIEIVEPDGTSHVDIVFKRGHPLPAEKTVPYRAKETLRRSEHGQALNFKLWEGEVTNDPQANTFIGVMQIRSEDIRRPIPEGSEIELTLKLDASREMHIEAFIPFLNETFAEDVYVPEPTTYEQEAAQAEERLDDAVERLMELRERAESGEVDVPVEKVDQAIREVEDLQVEAGQHRGETDDNRRLVERTRVVSSRLFTLEQEAGTSRGQDAEEAAARQALEEAEDVSERFGSPNDVQMATLLRQQLERALDKGDARSVKKATEALADLKWNILFQQDWFWEDIFTNMAQPGRTWTNASEARRLLAQGHQALSTGDADTVREVVGKLFKLQPKDEAESLHERALNSGLMRA